MRVAATPTFLVVMAGRERDVKEPKINIQELCVRPPPENCYFIKNAATASTLKACDDGASSAGKQIERSFSTDSEDRSLLWYLEHTGDEEYYYIVSKSNGLLLAVNPATPTEANVPLTQMPKSSPPFVTANQKWKILEDGYIILQLNGQLITDHGGTLSAANDKPRVTVERKSGHSKQKWNLHQFPPALELILK